MKRFGLFSLILDVHFLPIVREKEKTLRWCVNDERAREQRAVAVSFQGLLWEKQRKIEAATSVYNNVDTFSLWLVSFLNYDEGCVFILEVKKRYYQQQSRQETRDCCSFHPTKIRHILYESTNEISLKYHIVHVEKKLFGSDHVFHRGQKSRVHRWTSPMNNDSIVSIDYSMRTRRKKVHFHEIPVKQDSNKRTDEPFRFLLWDDRVSPCVSSDFCFRSIKIHYQDGLSQSKNRKYELYDNLDWFSSESDGK